MRALALILVVAACGGARRHGAGPSDPDHLYVEIRSDGSPLRRGAEAGLARIPFAVPVDDGGDVLLQVELAKLAVVGNQTTCKLKILVLRLPQHDLLGIADGGARAGGTDAQARNDCIESLGATLVRGKVRSLLKRRLDDKR